MTSTTHSTPSDLPPMAIPQLRATVRGQVIAPADAGYDAARTVFVGGLDRRPQAIVRVADARDVSRVVTFARERGVELAVRGGGHSLPGYGVSDGGIVIDLSAMTALDIDPDNRTAWAQAGLTTGAYTTAAAAHGLATAFGDTGSVGIGGITLAGGVGYLVRKHGLTIDDLLAAEIVTADGEIRHVDADTHPDLFWAIRGGGGNFGVVTRFTYRLHAVDTVTGGMLMLPATPDTIAGFVALAMSAPEELSTIANVMLAPPMPFIPAEHHGTPVLLAMLAHTGAVEEGERAVAPFKALAEPLVDMVGPKRYPELFPPEEEYHPIASTHTMFLDAVDRPLAETILDSVRSATAQMAVAQLRVLGGAMARVPADATAFAHRDAGIMTYVAAMYGHPDEAPEHAPWVNALARAMDQGRDGAYTGFMGDEGEAGVRAAYPGATWERLRAVKATYDPGNLFRLNQNIPPAPAVADRAPERGQAVAE